MLALKAASSGKAAPATSKKQSELKNAHQMGLRGNLYETFSDVPLARKERPLVLLSREIHDDGFFSSSCVKVPKSQDELDGWTLVTSASF